MSDATQLIAMRPSPTYGGLQTAHITHPSGGSCDVVLLGAHVTSWKTADGVERLFMSSASAFGDKPIRGGIPVCWPQFNMLGPLPKHGFARTSDEWQVEAMRTTEAGDPQLVLKLSDSAATRKLWPHAFKLRYVITLAPDSLEAAIELTNAGEAPLTFTGALHTYFAVPDVTAVAVRGLRGTTYADNANGAGGVEVVEESDGVALAGEVDRVYQAAPDELVVRAPGRADLVVRKRGLRDAVLWNLGEAKAPTMADLGAGEWRHYVCLEAAAIAEPVTVAPGAFFEAAQSFQIVGGLCGAASGCDVA